MVLTAIRDGILGAYPPVIKRIRNWLLPLVLILLLVSAYGRFMPAMLRYFSAIALTSAHFYCGWILGMLWLILVYDFIFNLLTRRSDSQSPAAGSGFPAEPIERNVGLRRLVDTVFHSVLLLVFLSGLVQYGTRQLHWHPVNLHQLEVSLTHAALSWLLLAAALVKYYLSFNRWLSNLLAYLREE